MKSSAKFWTVALTCLCASTIATGAYATVILSPTAATASSETSGGYGIGNTINQSGLSAGFTSGVTNFDTYLAGNPTHTTTAAGNEWFSAYGVTSATVTYDLGTAWAIDRLALWNEESAGIGMFNVFVSLDGVTFTQVGFNLAPFDNPLTDYPAQVFGLGLHTARYVRMDVSGCPQPDPGGYDSCAIGEVAFSAASATSVPEPGSLAIFGAGLAGFAGLIFFDKRRRTLGRLRDSTATG